MPEALHRSRANARGSPRPRRAAPHHGARGANARDAPTHGTRWGRHPALGTSWPSCARLGSLSRARRPPGHRAGLPSEPVPRLSSESPAPREAGDSPGAAAATPREPAPRACDLPAPERRAHHLAPVLRRVGGTPLCHRNASSAQWSGVHESGATPNDQKPPLHAISGLSAEQRNSGFRFFTVAMIGRLLRRCPRPRRRWFRNPYTPFSSVAKEIDNRWARKVVEVCCQSKQLQWARREVARKTD